MNLTVSVDVAAVLLGLQATADALSDSMGLLNEAGSAVSGHVKNRIRTTKTDPSAVAWAAWAPSTEKKRISKGNEKQGLLWDSGLLLESITHEVSGDTVMIGTGVLYAEYLQFGTEKMPAREFLGWDNESESLAMAAVEAHIRKAI